MSDELAVEEYQAVVGAGLAGQTAALHPIMGASRTVSM